jgi:AraC-like DNA-binding protein
MHERGFTSEQVLAGTGLTEAHLDDSWLSPTPENYHQIIRNMLDLTGDPHLGLHIGSEYKVSDLGVLGYAALSSETLAQAREVMLKYAALNEYILTPANYICSGVWYNLLRETFPLGELLPFAIEEFISRMIALSSSLTGRKFRIQKLEVTYPEPQPAGAYQAFFQCPCYFGRPKMLVTLDKQRLSDQITLADPEVFQLCKKQCQDLVKIKSDEANSSEKIKCMLLKMPGKFPYLEELAKMLNKSSRTLRRELSEEGTSYLEIVDETRKELAVQYLQHTRLTPKEISYALGYSQVSNFRRAFKSWTGKTFSEYKLVNC